MCSHTGTSRASFARATPVTWSRWACVSRIATGLQPVLLHRLQQQVDIVAGIDDDRLAGDFAAEDESVLHERGNGARFEDHEPAAELHFRIPE